MFASELEDFLYGKASVASALEQRRQTEEQQKCALVERKKEDPNYHCASEDEASSYHRRLRLEMREEVVKPLLANEFVQAIIDKLLAKDRVWTEHDLALGIKD